MVHRIRYKIDGRTVNIIDKTNQAKDFFLFYNFNIGLFCNEHLIAKKFPVLTFILCYDSHGPARDAMAYVKSSDMEKGKHRVYLNLKHIPVYDSSGKFSDKFNEKIIASLNHELTHLLHQQQSQVYSLRTKVDVKLNKALRKFSLYRETNVELAEMRLLLFDFFELMVTEGLAYFFEDFQAGKINFTDDEVNMSYSIAVVMAESVSDAYTKFLKNPSLDITNLLELFRNTERDIGLHVIYLLISHNYDFVDLLRYSPKKVIKEYEKLILSEYRLPPIVSLTDKSGILSYKKMLAEWWKAFKKTI